MIYLFKHFIITVYYLFIIFNKHKKINTNHIQNNTITTFNYDHSSMPVVEKLLMSDDHSDIITITTHFHTNLDHNDATYELKHHREF